jgi:hypothetical protein
MRHAPLELRSIPDLPAYHQPNKEKGRETMRSFKLLLATASLALAGCATLYTVPKEYTGPTADLADSVMRESPGVLRVYAALKIDGKPADNAIGASAQRSQTFGSIEFGLLEASVTRKVEARPMKVELRAQHMAAAFAGFALLAKGQFYYNHTGVVDFDPKPGHKYQVKGAMGPEEIAVWIEDTATGERVTDKVAKKP